MDAILFDLDGTLVDTEPLWIGSQRYLANQFGIHWTREDEIMLVGRSMGYAATALQARGVNMEVDTIIETRVKYVTHRLQDEIPWKIGAQLLLANIRERQIPCALVTMSPRPVVQTILAGLPTRTFDATVTGSDCDQDKPHPEPYRRALSLLGVSAGRSLAVEDSITGAQSAEAAGLPVAIVPSEILVASSPGRFPVSSLLYLIAKSREEITAAGQLSSGGSDECPESTITDRFDQKHESELPLHIDADTLPAVSANPFPFRTACLALTANRCIDNSEESSVWGLLPEA